MKYKSGISLVETLISMAIVGVALVALLPVMTLKKEGNDQTLGNRYWTADSNNIATPTVNKIGVGFTSTDTIPTKSFEIKSTGRGNTDLVPLNITNRLNQNGQIVTTNNGLNLKVENAQELNVANNKIIIKNSAGNDSIYYSSTGSTVIGIGNNATRTDASTNYNTGNLLSIGNVTGNIEGASVNSIIGIFPLPETHDVTDNTSYVLYGINNGADTDWKINGNLVVTGSITADGVLVSSDKRLKNIVSKYTKGLKDILMIKPTMFTYKADKNQQLHIGVIAQELQPYFPEAVLVNKTTGYFMVNQEPVMYALLNSIKELNARNIEIQKQNKILEEKIAKLESIKEKHYEK